MTMFMLDWHWVPAHREGDDWTLFKRTRSPFVKVVWEGEPAYALDVKQAGAKYVYRDYQVSENFMNRDLISVTDAARIGRETPATYDPSTTNCERRGLRRMKSSSRA